MPLFNRHNSETDTSDLPVRIPWPLKLLGCAALAAGVVIAIMLFVRTLDKSASSTGETSNRLITITRPIPFETVTITSSDVPEDAREVKVAGADGVASLTYRVTFVGALGSTKKLVKRVVQSQPVTQVVVVGKRSGSSASAPITVSDPVPDDEVSFDEGDPIGDDEDEEIIDCESEPELCVGEEEE